jgi:hypothetical protein
MKKENAHQPKPTSANEQRKFTSIHALEGK